jgi:hypothetical protein
VSDEEDKDEDLGFGRDLTRAVLKNVGVTYSVGRREYVFPP